MSKFRRYTFQNGARILVSWVDRQCRNCGRFLPKGNTKEVCTFCSKKNMLVYSKLFYRINEEFREERKLRQMIYRNPFRFIVGEVV